MAPDRGEEAATTMSLSSDVNSLSLHDNAADGVQIPHPTSTVEQQIPAHLSHDPATNTKRSDPFQFGQRFLNEETDDVFTYNAWDHVTPDDEHIAFAEAQYEKQRNAPVSEFDKSRFNNNPEKWWDLFYKQKSATFFKDRKWLVQEFPVLGDVTRKGAGKRVVLEVGAGAGNTAFPLMRMNENTELEVVAVDFSKKAVETMRNAEDYQAIADGVDGRVGRMRAEVWDAASTDLPEGVAEGSADVVIMIFIFSALSPQQWEQAVRNVWRVLKPGGEVLFRDYGRGDLAQVRFKAGRWLEENFYVRGDGTRVYFFDKDELSRIWSGSDNDGTSTNGVMSCDQDGLEDRAQEEVAQSGVDTTVDAVKPHFDILNLDVDRRLIVNRQRRIKMYRCWMQGRFRKPKT